MEIHFMHSQLDTTNSMNIDAVIAVRAKLTGTLSAEPFQDLVIDNPETTSKNITNFTLSRLLPVNDTKDYYHYNGSLTQPNCTEGVKWFVLKNSTYVPPSILTPIQTIAGEKSYNHRTPQPLNNRTVTTPKMTTPGSSAVVTTSSLIAVLSVALLVIAGLN